MQKTMTTLTDVSWKTLSWQDLVKGAIQDKGRLLRELELPGQAHYSDFPILVPAPFFSRIEKGNITDPLLLQVLSSVRETEHVPGFTEQPLVEHNYSPVTGLIQKYYGRVLVIVSGACAVNCRYCFRRHFPYQSFQANTAQWQQILGYIKDDPTISEVILSGGDPLMLPDTRLKWLVNQIEKIDHISTLRIHTRLPVVIPQRICDSLLEWIEGTRLRIVMVNHINHANEVDAQVIEVMQRLCRRGVLLLNQSVLLRGVNDSVEVLSHLSERLLSAKIMPYYLHLLDPVSGAAHFEVEESTALAIMDQLRRQLPGYLVPKLVRELPGEASKVPV